jgi:hypothetical protein
LRLAAGVRVGLSVALRGGDHGWRADWRGTRGASTRDFALSWVWAKIVADKRVRVSMGVGRKRGMGRRGRRIPASDPNWPVKALGKFPGRFGDSPASGMVSIG